MKSFLTLAVIATSVVGLGHGAVAQDVAAPLMEAQEIVISTQGALAAGNIIVPLFMLLFVAAALSTTSAAPILPD